MRGRIKYTASGEKHFFIGEKEVSEHEFDRMFPSVGFEGSGKRLAGRMGVGATHVCKVRQNNPCFSDALAVHPKQVGEAEADSRKKGVPTDFLPDGRAVIKSRAHQKAYLKAYGFRNNDGGYGD